MRLSISKSKNSTSLYVIKSTYENGKHSSKVVEKLGTVKELEEKLNGRDPIEWAKKYIEELNKKDKENRRDVIVKYSLLRLLRKMYSAYSMVDICLFNKSTMLLDYIRLVRKFQKI